MTETSETRPTEAAKQESRSGGPPTKRGAAWRRLQEVWDSLRIYTWQALDLLRDLWQERQKLIQARELQKLTRNAEAAPITFPFALPFFAGGLLLLAVFLPFAIASALASGGDPIGIILLQEAPPGLPKDFFAKTFPAFSLPPARPMVYSFAVLYGIISVVAAVIITAGGLPKLVITSNGLFWGYHLTKYLLADLFDVIAVDAFTGSLFNLKLAYTFMGFYLAFGISNLLSVDDYAREKNDFFLSGLYGLFAGWLLGRGFGTDAVAFSGLIFLVCTYGMIWLAERVLRPVLEIMEIAVGADAWEYIAEERHLSLSELAMFTRLTLAGDGRLLFLLTTIVVGFPFLVGLLYVAFLEGLT